MYSLNKTEMEVIIIEKKTFEKIVSDALALEKQVNALCAMNEGKPANAWLDGEDVCRRLHIAPRRLQTLRNSRRLNYAQIGRKFYYKAKDIEDFLLSCKEETHKQEKI